VSAASAWELAIKFQQGKLRKAADLVSNFSNRIAREGFQSQAENMPIISNEAVFEAYGVRRLW
jgi:PIN domain nuclease of toxin-antitoxin system